MQTFMPYVEFDRVAACLDDRRLGAQRKEAAQILQINLCIPTARGEDPAGWRNHPIVRLWHGHEVALCDYGIAMCIEYGNRGFQDNLITYFMLLKAFLLGADALSVVTTHRAHLRPAAETPHLIRACVLWLLMQDDTRQSPERDPDTVAWRAALPPVLRAELSQVRYRRLLIDKLPSHYAPHWPEIVTPATRAFWLDQALAVRSPGTPYEQVVSDVDDWLMAVRN
jgi:hypothetical protein